MPHTEDFITVSGATIRLLRGGRAGRRRWCSCTAPAGIPAGWRSSTSCRGISRSIAPEHPGFGRSDDPPWLDEVGDLAYFYLDFSAGAGARAGASDRHLARRLDRRRAGGAQHGAARQPDPGRRGRHHRRRRADRRHLPHAGRGESAALLRRSRSARRGGSATWRRSIMSLVAKNRATVTRLAYRPRFHNPHLAKWLHRIDVPTLLVWGDKDGLVPPEFGEAYRDADPGLPSRRAGECRPRAVRRAERRVPRRLPRFSPDRSGLIRRERRRRSPGGGG